MDIDIPLPGEDIPLCNIEPPDIPMPDDPIELPSRVFPEPASESVESTAKEIDVNPPPLPTESSSTIMGNEEDEDIDDSNR